MTFKEFLNIHKFILIKASFTNRFYSNGVYDIHINNHTNLAILSRCNIGTSLAVSLNCVKDDFNNWNHTMVY